MTTTDFTKFGYRERALAAELLIASTGGGFPDDFETDEVTIIMDQNSGDVFFTNADFQIRMMAGDKLESFYSCPICGHEGFAEEMHPNADNDDCQEYLKDLSNRNTQKGD